MSDSVQSRNRRQAHHDRAVRPSRLAAVSTSQLTAVRHPVRRRSSGTVLQCPHDQRATHLQGAITWTIFGAAACTIAHFTWPAFRKQTLGLKAFLTSSATVAGLVIGADSHLLKYEAETRRRENDLRRLARNELAKEGIIASEGEIRKWREVYDRRMAELSQSHTPAPSATPAPDSQSPVQ
ncbi:hypothetical protein DB88DRAFT_313337 [Papiliotrema laurentii]|uniref:HIG1 domain-containing protein n=1 Tax=Papiliotrema laurentii TaxID=5418 RepID=A0AAD9CXA5_PAPLA|nr:hypothetical protein DB88DRAFT_313337 [Papiliotrema laurentii]